ncbi:RHTO0S26e00276g1_1 [Rhodotorula toruloides]|uniref:RHTO0S26e00276g1_1 n=1 Tax=Rhodotorula toruloides TaxID=5286 RepID=A0A061BQL8_RHOTO|nr:RHTO0S26e00276g1_1 [Rhodotorula toruloides]
MPTNADDLARMRAKLKVHRAPASVIDGNAVAQPFQAEYDEVLNGDGQLKSTRTPILSDRDFAGTVTKIRYMPRLAQGIVNRYERTVLAKQELWYGEKQSVHLPGDLGGTTFGTTEDHAAQFFNVHHLRLAQHLAQGSLDTPVLRGSQQTKPPVGASDLSLFLAEEPFLEVIIEKKKSSALTTSVARRMCDEATLSPCFNMAQRLPPGWESAFRPRSEPRITSQFPFKPYSRRSHTSPAQPISPTRKSVRQAKPSTLALIAAESELLLEDARLRFSRLDVSRTRSNNTATFSSKIQAFGGHNPLPVRDQPLVSQWIDWGVFEEDSQPTNWVDLDADSRQGLCIFQQVAVQLGAVRHRLASKGLKTPFQPVIIAHPSLSLPMLLIGSTLIVAGMVENDPVLTARIIAVFFNSLVKSMNTKSPSPPFDPRTATQTQILDWFGSFDYDSNERRKPSASAQQGNAAAPSSRPTTSGLNDDLEATGAGDAADAAATAYAPVLLDSSVSSNLSTPLDSSDFLDSSVPAFTRDLDRSTEAHDPPEAMHSLDSHNEEAPASPRPETSLDIEAHTAFEAASTAQGVADTSSDSLDSLESVASLNSVHSAQADASFSSCSTTATSVGEDGVDGPILPVELALTAGPITPSLASPPPSPQFDKALELVAHNDFASLSGCYYNFEADEPPAMSDDAPRLEIAELVGVGGSGAVFADSDRRYAVKVVTPYQEETTADYQLRAAEALQEHAVLDRLSNQLCPEVPYYHGLFGQKPLNGEVVLLLVSDFVEGVVFETWEAVNRHRQDCLQAVKSLHDAGVVHGDLRPSNFILRYDGSVAVVDYGRASLGAQPEDLEAERLQFLRDMTDGSHSDMIAPAPGN